MVLKKLSATALSQQLPFLPMDRVIFELKEKREAIVFDAYCAPLSEWKIRPGLIAWSYMRLSKLVVPYF
jgi:hypothetical protein